MNKTGREILWPLLAALLGVFGFGMRIDAPLVTNPIQVIGVSLSAIALITGVAIIIAKVRKLN